MQESEQELETKRQQKNKTEAEFANIIAVLEANEAANTAKIARTMQEKDALLGVTEDSEGQFIDENTKQRIEESTQKLYITAKDFEVKANDPEYAKLISQDTLPMLNEIECILNQYLETFQQFEQDDPERFQQVQKRILTELRKKNRIENSEKEKIAAALKKEQRDREQNSRVFKKIGKPHMRKIWAKPLKK